jgi:hypothetical protein
MRLDDRLKRLERTVSKQIGDGCALCRSWPEREIVVVREGQPERGPNVCSGCGRVQAQMLLDTGIAAAAPGTYAASVPADQGAR